MSQLTDDEFEAKVEELRKTFKDEMLKAVGADKIMGGDNDQFMDAYSIGVFANLSNLATLAGIFMSRLVVVHGYTKEKAIEETSVVYHSFLHEVLDRGEESMEHALAYLKNYKQMN